MSSSDPYREPFEAETTHREDDTGQDIGGPSRPENPYSATTASESGEPIEGELLDPRLPAAEPTSLPHPSLGWAILWAGLPLLAQVAVIASVLVVINNWSPVAQYRTAEIEEFVNRLNVYLLPLGTLTTVCVALAVVGIGYRGQVASRLAWRNCTSVQWLGAILLVAPLAILASEVGNCVADLLPMIEPDWLREFRESNGEMFADFVSQPWLLVFLGGCVFPGIGEEIYCRGFLSRGLIARYGVVAGTLFTSLLFGAMHVDPLQSCQAFVLGLGLQFVFLTTRSLWAPIAVHTLNNFAAFLLMSYEEVVPIPGLSSPPADETVVHTPLLLLGAATVAFLATAGLLMQTRTRWVLSDGSPWSPGYPGAEAPPAWVGAQPIAAAPHLGLVSLTAAAYALLLAALIAG